MRLIPTPKNITELEGTFDLAGKFITLEAGCEYRVCKCAQALCDKINACGGEKSYVKLGKSGNVFVTHGNAESAGYALKISENYVEVCGAGAKGAFYGLQTLMQLITLSGGTKIPCMLIEDKPDYTVRGFYHDITRGRVPTLETLKEIIDEMASYKLDQLQLYVEDSFAFKELEGVMKDDEVLSADEIIELDNYCYERFIELVPSVASFGHLYNQLQCENFKHLCEYENYEPHQHYWLEKMSHHTVDVSNDESLELVCSRIDQFAALCRSDKFNICCDETFDLCKGKNAGKDAGKEYFDFVLKIIDHMKKIGKRSMMWGDIVLEHPEKLALLPADTIMLNWCYSKEPIEKDVKTFAASGMTQYVCPSTNAWNRYIEQTGIGHDNISRMARFGHESGAEGFLNTNWGDYGNVCSLGAEKYGFVLGAERAWNATDEPLDTEWHKTFSKLVFFPDKTVEKSPDMVDIIFKASLCEENVRWMEFVPWFSANYIENRDIPLYEVDEKLCRANIETLTGIVEMLRSFGGENLNMHDFRLAVEAVIMMNKFHLHFAGFEKEPVDNSAWLKEYSGAWLDRCKPSQLYVVQEFLSNVFTK